MQKITAFIFFLLSLYFIFLVIFNFQDFKTEFKIIQLIFPKIELFEYKEALKEYYPTEKEEIAVKIENSDFNGKEIEKEKIIKLTNLERINYGLNSLSENEKLNQMALIKVEDMFFRQYFAHIAPTGEDISNLADMVFYSYIYVGENLAKGNFINGEDLLNGWMNSPDHRDNILKSEYTEIGVAVIKDDYKGNQIWMAVQIFGTPSKLCPTPSEDLLLEINKQRKNLDLMKEEIDELEKEISKIKPARGKHYIDKMSQYNSLVEEYNLLREFTSKLISVYNNQIEERNSCLKNL